MLIQPWANANAEPASDRPDPQALLAGERARARGCFEALAHIAVVGVVAAGDSIRRLEPAACISRSTMLMCASSPFRKTYLPMNDPVPPPGFSGRPS
jgi:hypothetical protein